MLSKETLQSTLVLMSIFLFLGVLTVLGSQIFGRHDALSDIHRESLTGLSIGDARQIDWQGKKVWLVRRSKQIALTLSDLDEVVRDPYSKNKPLNTGVSSRHRALLPEFFIAFAKGQKCHVEYRLAHDEEAIAALGRQRWYGGFYEPCVDLWYDLAGRVYLSPEYQDHLQVPDYRIVGAQLLLGSLVE